MRLRYSPAGLILFALAAHAADAALDRATLRGLNKIGVVIDRLDAELVQQGFSEATLQSRVEERLRTAGIPVAADAPDFLGIGFMHVRDGRGPFALCLTAGMYQQVTLTRDRNVKTSTQTWEVQTVLMAGSKVVYRVTLDSLDELVDRFVAAWKAVNPKP